jgi:hypothetical protein
MVSWLYGLPQGGLKPSTRPRGSFSGTAKPIIPSSYRYGLSRLVDFQIQPITSLITWGCKPPSATDGGSWAFVDEGT